jgi:hypothetical protein
VVRIRSIDDQPHRHPGDSRELDPIGRPPDASAVERVRDVLIVPTLTSDGDWESFPPFQGEPIDLGRGLCIEVLDEEEAELVMNACTERGHHFWAQRQFGAMYAFVLEVDLAIHEQQAYAWDVEGVLVRTLELSRYVQDNGYGTEFAARVIDFEGGQKQVIPQGSWHVYYLATYRVREDRDWLTREQADELATLLDAWWRNSEVLPARVERAISLCEGVAHQAVIERALVMLFMAFEALINTNKVQVSKQVGVRLRALASDLHLDGISRRFIDDMYDDRSAPAHGRALEKLFPVMPPRIGSNGESAAEGPDGGVDVDRDYLARLARLQDFLRALLRRAIEDPAFAQLFSTDTTIEARWPLEPAASEAPADRRAVR